MSNLSPAIVVERMIADGHLSPAARERGALTTVLDLAELVQTWADVNALTPGEAISELAPYGMGGALSLVLGDLGDARAMLSAARVTSAGATVLSPAGTSPASATLATMAALDTLDVPELVGTRASGAGGVYLSSIRA